MGEAAGHRFGQIIGEEIFEKAIYTLLKGFAEKHQLYLDKEGTRPARKGKSVKWKDRYGNVHDLDFVMEKGGTSLKTGQPVAFIEVAWRSYTKHSKNKAQEIEGAIVPLVDTHSRVAPFAGVILAGRFTNNALTQLRSRGFKVLYFPSDSVFKAIRVVGIDGYFDEVTPDKVLAEKISAWSCLSEDRRSEVRDHLIASHSAEIEQFLASLEAAVNRQIACVRVFPLHGKAFDMASVDEAIKFVEAFHLVEEGAPVRYEIDIRFNNGDQIRGLFAERYEALEFLMSFQPPPLESV